MQRETYKQKGNDMSTATLNGLRDYLYDTLSPANLIWLGKQLTEYGYMQEKPQKPYTKEELKARIEQYDPGTPSSCGDITIKNSVTHVYATAGSGAEKSIGSGQNSKCGTVTIEDPSKVTQQ